MNPEKFYTLYGDPLSLGSTFLRSVPYWLCICKVIYVMLNVFVGWASYVSRPMVTLRNFDHGFFSPHTTFEFFRKIRISSDKFCSIIVNKWASLVPVAIIVTRWRFRGWILRRRKLLLPENLKRNLYRIVCYTPRTQSVGMGCKNLGIGWSRKQS